MVSGAACTLSRGEATRAEPVEAVEEMQEEAEEEGERERRKGRAREGGYRGGFARSTPARGQVASAGRDGVNAASEVSERARAR